MRIKITLSVLTWLLMGSLSVQGRTTPRTIEFSKLSDYVNAYSERRDGERLIVTEVPPIGRLTYNKRNNIYSFNPDDSGDVGNTFFTSPTLAKSLRHYLQYEGGAATARIYCTLVQFVSSQDVYRSPFVTKVEGFDENGKLAWTAVGPPPVKFKMPE